MLNPEIVKVCKSYLNNFVVQEALKYALSWYLGFKWLIPENRPLEELYREARIKAYPIRDSLYRLYRRNFLKGIIHAGLC